MRAAVRLGLVQTMFGGPRRLRSCTPHSEPQAASLDSLMQSIPGLDPLLPVVSDRYSARYLGIKSQLLNATRPRLTTRVR
jgi:hypothetical protein